MKLAEALAVRADLQKRVELLRTRLVESAKVQEGETPAGDPPVLFRELDQSLTQLVTLITQINRLNLQTLLPDGSTLTILAIAGALYKKSAGRTSSWILRVCIEAYCSVAH